MRLYKLLFYFLTAISQFVDCATTKYSWLKEYDESNSIAKRISSPKGYVRIEVEKGSFVEWLRNLPLKKDGTLVYLYDGMKKANQDAHFAVVDIDTGKCNLQQCADAVIRLRAEYLYSNGNYKAIHFNFTNGQRVDFTKWSQGFKPVEAGNKIEWRKSAENGKSYESFRKYLDTVFIYAGSYSLSKELEKVGNIKEMKIGDIFIKGGFPGHAVIIVDMAVNKKTGKKIFLLAQSYMPAQDIHILKNPAKNDYDPWYDLDFGKELKTPEWTFKAGELMRFRQEE
jgi:hypothetical protein